MLRSSYIPYRLYIRGAKGTWDAKNYNATSFKLQPGSKVFIAHEGSAPDLLNFRLSQNNSSTSAFPTFKIATQAVSGTFNQQSVSTTVEPIYDIYNNSALRVGDGDTMFDFDVQRPVLFSPDQSAKGEAATFVDVRKAYDPDDTSDTVTFDDDPGTTPLYWIIMEVPSSPGGVFDVEIDSVLYSPLCAYATPREVFESLQLTSKMLGVRVPRDELGIVRSMDIDNFSPLTRPPASIVRRYINDAQAAINYSTTTAWKPVFNQFVFNFPQKHSFSLIGRPIREMVRAVRQTDPSTFKSMAFGEDYILNSDTGHVYLRTSNTGTYGANSPLLPYERVAFQIGYIYGYEMSHRGFPIAKRYARAYAARSVLNNIMFTQFGSDNTGALQSQINILTSIINESNELLQGDRIQVT